MRPGKSFQDTHESNKASRNEESHWCAIQQRQTHCKTRSGGPLAWSAESIGLTTAELLVGKAVQATKSAVGATTKFLVTGATAAARESSQQRHGLDSADDVRWLKSK
jgi:hypothetical protein